jgi:hypothetical protein
MKSLLTVLFLGVLLSGNTQTYMYIDEALITPESPVTPTDIVSIQLIGNFSDTGAGVEDYEISLSGMTVLVEITASSEGGGAALVPFDLTYELGMYEVGEYTVEVSGPGVSMITDEELTFVVEDDGTGSLSPALDEVGIQIYPNPTVDFIRINYEKWENNTQVEILSSESKIVLSKSINAKTTELKVSHLVNGVYFVRVLDPNGKAIRTERIVIAR